MNLKGRTAVPKLLTLKEINAKLDKVLEEVRVQASFNTPVRGQVNNFAVRLVALERKFAEYPKIKRTLFGVAQKVSIRDFTADELTDELKRRLEDPYDED
jgi:hypothetical protein